jgi:hypothetical protein
MTENSSNIPADTPKNGDVTAPLLGHSNMSQLGTSNFVSSNVLSSAGTMSSLPNTVPTSFPMGAPNAGTDFNANAVGIATTSMSLGILHKYSYIYFVLTPLNAVWCYFHVTAHAIYGFRTFARYVFSII